MSGIYLHIPFCKQACHYCDFHFSTNLRLIEQMVHAMGHELRMRSIYLEGNSVNTIYFGGGTPSLLPPAAIASFLETIRENYHVSENPEITMEANPDDINLTTIHSLRAAGINRLSIGIQTFDDTRLKFINRAHTSLEARQCLEMAIEGGFDNVSADLIYAIPPEDLTYWEKDLDEILSFDLSHLSIYGLTVEDQTVFGRWMKRGKFSQVTEEIATRQYLLAVEKLTRQGYTHYEVSNFAKSHRESRHNSSYWSGEKYLGIGPGAHSYNGHSRSANIRNNYRYIEELTQHQRIPQTIETLSPIQVKNEYILTHLRTAKGIVYDEFRLRFEQDFEQLNQPFLSQLIENEMALADTTTFRLTTRGLMVADEISLNLFYEE